MLPVEAKTKAVKSVAKEKLVLMPLRLGEEDQNLQGAMETALVEGLQQKYIVISGEQVAKKAREIFMKESKNTAHKECDETRCLQGIAESFQSELLAIANVTKQDGGYFLSLSIRNLYDNIDVYSKSIPCERCNAFQTVEKLKELVGARGVEEVAAETVTTQGRINLNDPDTALWEEVKKGNAEEDYQAYLSQFPKGKYAALAKTKLNRLKEEARVAAGQQDQQAWSTAQQGNTQDHYAGYLEAYPQGQFAALAQGRIDKLKREAAAEEAKRRREESEVAARGPRPGGVYKDCSDCPEMVMLPSGRFEMGSPSNETDRKDDEGPVHPVNVHEFLMGKTDITRGQFAAFVNNTNYDAGNKCWIYDGKWEERDGFNWRNPGFSQQDNHPVTCINWNDAKAYADWLSRKTGKQYRLPSEAEWEYAARAGTTTARYWGRDPDQACSYANGGDQTRKSQMESWKFAIHNCNDNYSYTSPVANYKPNAFGLYDMLGNLFQWTEDGYHDNYNGAPDTGSEWPGDGSKRVLRGGSWNDAPTGVRAAFRSVSGQSIRFNSGGFRLARMAQ